MRRGVVRVGGERLLVRRRGIGKLTAHSLGEPELAPGRSAAGILLDGGLQRGFGFVEAVRLALEQREVDLRPGELRVAGRERFELELGFAGVARLHQPDGAIEIRERPSRDRQSARKDWPCHCSPAGRAAGSAVPAHPKHCATAALLRTRVRIRSRRA